MKRYRGNRYRKRNKVLLTVLSLFLILSLSACVFIVTENYVVFTSTGIEIRLPFLRREEGPDVDDGPPLQIEELPQKPAEDQPQPPPEETPEQPPDEPEDTAPETLWAVAVDAARLTDEVYLDGILALADTTGVNAVMVDLKNQDGTLNYVSAASAAVAANASAGAGDIAPGIKRLREGGVYVIGRVYCMRDNTVSRQVRSTAIKTASGATWLDWEYGGWLSPYEESARAYLTEIVRECAALGVSEIALDDFCFPYRGKFSVISYPDGAAPKADVLTALLEELAAACAQTETKLSLIPVRESVETGAAPEQGQELAGFVPYVSRVYFALTESEAASAAPALIERVAALAPDKTAFAVPMIEAATNNKAAIDALLQRQSTSFVLRNAAGIYSPEDFN